MNRLIYWIRGAFLILFLTAVIISSFVLPNSLRANSQPTRQDLLNTDTSVIKTYATLSVTRKHTFAIPPDRFELLMSELELTAGLVRAWKLERYRAEEQSKGMFDVRDGAGLSGRVLQVEEKTGFISYVGIGEFQSSRLPFRAHGRAFAEIWWEETENEGTPGTKIKATLSARIDNLALHLMSQLLYPIVKSIANNKTDHLIDVANKLVEKLSEHPNETRQRLREIDPNLLPLLDQK